MVITCDVSRTVLFALSTVRICDHLKSSCAGLFACHRSFNVIIYANGKAGLNCEHSWAGTCFALHGPFSVSM